MDELQCPSAQQAQPADNPHLPQVEDPNNERWATFKQRTVFESATRDPITIDRTMYDFEVRDPATDKWEIDSRLGGDIEMFGVSEEEAMSIVKWLEDGPTIETAPPCIQGYTKVTGSGRADEANTQFMERPA